MQHDPGTTPAGNGTRMGTAGAAAILRRMPWNLLRGFALFLGAFTLLNALGALLFVRFDANIWWIDLEPFLPHGATILTAAIGLALLGLATRPAMGNARRWITLALLGVAALGTLANGTAYLRLRGAGAVDGFPLPFSFLMFGGMMLLIVSVAANWHVLYAQRSPRLHGLAVAAGFVLCLVLFPLAQILCFGGTNYSRRADAIVVLGAKAYADGGLSGPLADRVQTAIELYKHGLAPVVIMSGGPTDGAIHETEAMRRYAVRRGVPASAILTDTNGLNTRATAEHTVPMLRKLGARSVLVVSHAYHLPRIKMAFQQQGWNVFTVPASEVYTITGIPMSTAREVAGFWYYYVTAFFE